MANKNPYDSKKTFDISEEERAGRNKSLGAAEGMLSPASEALGQFYDPNGMSAYAKGQQTLRESDTNKRFNDSQAAQRMRARMSGFGYEQPAEQAGEGFIENARAAELSRIPAETQKEASEMAMQAVGLQNGLANTELGVANQFSPESYYQTGAQQAEQEAQRRGGLWKSLAGLGMNLAAPFTSGLAGKLFKSK